MHGSKRAPSLALALALSTAILVTGSAAAAQRSTGVTGVAGSGVMAGYTANFGAIWQQGQTTLAWTFDDFELWAVVPNGLNCDPLICASWSYVATIRFLDASGAQVGNVISPPFLQCYAAATAPGTKTFYKCRNTSFGQPLAANRVQLHWEIWKTSSNGFRTRHWNVTKTVAL